MPQGPTSTVKGILFDLDGVLWRGDVLLPLARETVIELRERGYSLAFVSNNSLHGYAGMKRKFERHGIPLAEGELCLATRVLAKAIADKLNRATVYLIGSQGFKEDLEAHGLRVLEEPEEIDYLTDYVVVGGDWDFNYKKLTRALRCVKQGAKIAAPNADLYFPHEEGLLPGNGAVLAAIAAMAKRPPDLVVGKPQPHILTAAMERMDLPPDQCIMVGDSVDTDVAAAHAAGVRSVLVLSGNTTERDLKDASLKPWRVINGIAELPALLENLAGAP